MTSDDDRLAPVTYLSTWSGGGPARAASDDDLDSTIPPARDGAGESASTVSQFPTVTAAPTEPEASARYRSPAHPAGSALRRASGSTAEADGEASRPSPSAEAGEPARGDRSSRSRRPENVSMHALTRRGMSRWELEKLLETREVDAEEIAVELARLEAVGLVDDAALAETVVRTQHERKGLGRSAVKAEMRRRHIDQEQIDAALEDLDDDSELARARELAQRRAPQLASLDAVTAARRLSGYIARKGYSSSVVRTVVDEALKGPPSGVRFDD